MEVIDLNTLDNEMSDSIKLNIDNTNSNNSSLPSVNFGGGIELLMNDKAKSNSETRNNDEQDIENLDSIAQDLDNLSDVKIMSDDYSTIPTHDNLNVSFDTLPGKSTANLGDTNNKTWDGYDKFANVPINYEKNISTEPKLSKEELLKEKFKYLRKLEDLEKKGVHLTKSYDMESSLSEMQGEYETIISEKERSNSIKFQGRCLTALITGIEFLNSRFDPFDVKLDGWSEQINENIDDYDEIFAELHEKYKSKATMAPELKLIFQLGASGMMLHMTNTMFKSAMPGMDDIMRQNPDLAEQFTRAAVDSMTPNAPGFSGFMNNMMNNDNEPSNNFENMSVPPPSNRPDLNASKKNENIQREDMKGPSDISSLLSNLKPKTNIKTDDDNESTISLDDLRDITNKKMPKSTSKRRNTNQNTVSLDI
tara:strand:+ start:443 stop:1711 length:1269 start_codon:yes stop_codon:yes gene_type:complete